MILVHNNIGDTMKNHSIWLDDIPNIKTEEMTKNIQVDILIIGAGMTGINTAYFLKDCNQNIAVIDRTEVGCGVSAYTTGKITYLQNDIYHKLEKNLDYPTSFRYLKSQQEACKLLEQIIQMNHIDCNYQKNEGILFARNKKETDSLKKDEQFLKKAGVNVEKIKNLPNDYPCSYAIKIKDSAVFHSVKYIRNLAKVCQKYQIKIYEHVTAQEIKKEKNFFSIKTDKYEIKSKQVIIATHYPFFLLPMMIPFKTHLEKSHLLACREKKLKNFNAITNQKPSVTMRYYQNQDPYFIFGGNTYNMANEINYLEEEKKIQKEMEDFTNEKIIYSWSICDVTTRDYLPFIGRLDGKYENLYIATGYNKWGMTNSVLAGKIISDLILKKENIYSDLFDPKRVFSLYSFTNQLLDNCNMAKIFLKTKLKKNKSFYHHSVQIVHENGKSIGIYTDKNGIQHKVYNTCPHMKCSLIFNEAETCWDCPCHSSKFDIDGNCIKGPSVYSIKIVEND